MAGPPLEGTFRSRQRHGAAALVDRVEMLEGGNQLLAIRTRVALEEEFVHVLEQHLDKILPGLQHLLQLGRHVVAELGDPARVVLQHRLGDGLLLAERLAVPQHLTLGTVQVDGSVVCPPGTQLPSDLR